MDRKKLFAEFEELSHDYFDALSVQHGKNIAELVIAGIACKMHMYNTQNYSAGLKAIGIVIEQESNDSADNSYGRLVQQAGREIYAINDGFCKVFFNSFVRLVDPDISDQDMQLVDKLADEYCTKIIRWRDIKKAEHSNSGDNHG